MITNRQSLTICPVFQSARKLINLACLHCKYLTNWQFEINHFTINSANRAALLVYQTLTESIVRRRPMREVGSLITGRVKTMIDKIYNCHYIAWPLALLG